MMSFEFIPLKDNDLPAFKRDMQEAFQKGAMTENEDLDMIILPESDIDHSLSKKGAAAFKAVVNGEMLGGAVVIIDEKTQHNHLDFLYVKWGEQGNGLGKKMWQSIENIYPNTKVWETHTPYFEKRNIHFYVNQCGFKIVEFFNPCHPDPKTPNDMFGGDYFFRFEKQIE